MESRCFQMTEMGLGHSRKAEASWIKTHVCKAYSCFIPRSEIAKFLVTGEKSGQDAHACRLSYPLKDSIYVKAWEWLHILWRAFGDAWNEIGST